MIVPKMSAEEAHNAVMQRANECRDILKKTEEVMLLCTQTQLDCIEAKRVKTANLSEINNDLEKIRHAIEQLIKN